MGIEPIKTGLARQSVTRTTCRVPTPRIEEVVMKLRLSEIALAVAPPGARRTSGGDAPAVFAGTPVAAEITSYEVEISSRRSVVG